MRIILNRKGVTSYAPTLAAGIALAITFALSTAFAANLPKNCTDEIVALSKGNGFSMPQFASDLPAAVLKAKAQAKLPFGKPKDNEKTSIGMTFGCLKVFPESLGDIQSLLKDVSQEIGRGVVASQLGAGEQAQPQQYQQQQVPPEYQQQAQPQYQYPPQQYQQQQYAQPYYPPPQGQLQCPKCECNCYCGSQSRNFTASEEQYENFTGGQRFGTWLLNTIVPIGIGSAAVMKDATGMFIQLSLNALGITSIAVLGSEERCRDYYNGYRYDQRCYPEKTAFVPIGIGLLSVSAVFNIARSATYDKPNESGYSSKEHSGFNLAVLPNENGKFMPYVMYSKAF